MGLLSDLRSFAVRAAAEILTEAERARRMTEAARDTREAVRDYVAHLERRGVSEQHLYEARRYLERTILVPPQPATLAEVTTALVEERLRLYFRPGSSAQDHALVVLRAFCTWARLDPNPAKGVRRPKVVPGDPRASIDEEVFWRLVDPAGPVPFHRSTFYHFLAAQGVRYGAAAGIARLDLDLEKGLCRKRALSAKGKRESIMPLAKATCARLRELFRRQDSEGAPLPGMAGALPVFPHPPALRTFLRDLERVGIPRKSAEGKIDFHALRVLFVTRCQEKEVPLPLAQQLADHKRIDVTAHYTRLPSKAAREAVEKVAPRPPSEGTAA